MAKKGHIPWNKGIPRSERTKKKLSDIKKAHPVRYWLGKKRPKETKEKISKALKGNTPWNKNTKGLTKENSGSFQREHLPWNKGKKGEYSIWPNGRKMSEMAIQKMREAQLRNPSRYWLGKKRPEMTGSKNVNWLGGKSFELYGREFNRTLKEQIRARDNYRCQECFRHQDELYSKSGKKYKLLVHHIDYDKKNNNPINLISLCRSCHMQTNYKRNDWTDYFQNKLQLTQ